MGCMGMCMGIWVVWVSCMYIGIMYGYMGIVHVWVSWLVIVIILPKVNDLYKV